MSLAETKRPIQMPAVSNLYCYTPHCPGGYTSPSQLYSPAPVRSGKTPMSPVAPLDSPRALTTEFSDDDDTGDQLDECLNKFSRHITNDKNRTNHLYNFLYKQFGTRDSVTDRVHGPAGHTNAKPPIDQSSLIVPLNLSTSVQPKQSYLVSSVTADRLRDSCTMPQVVSRFGAENLIVKSHSLLDFDSRLDEEFTFRMQAEPFSLARDSLATGDLCVGVVCDESVANECFTQPSANEFADSTKYETPFSVAILESSTN
ncbi:hypothetical protein FBUS_05576 [Fasciolopsis buskii]|uniref:Uncharacterized protein n=1 Tax=Fasciolopsis buskii TaxID=27845 RepID=A0A8E0RXN5_9TREM|nr:hypothetical protein FBUS_05576 [Fasciolopsis buski]